MNDSKTCGTQRNQTKKMKLQLPMRKGDGGGITMHRHAVIKIM
jgi:hypothetical protein